LRTPLPVPPAALVCSLLLEDRSSVELKDTLDCPESKGVLKLNFCGKWAYFVEMRPKWMCQFVCGLRTPRRLCNCLR
jgi:hypothetical protein